LIEIEANLLEEVDRRIVEEMNDGDRGNIQFDLLTREPLEVILNPNYKGKNEIKVFDEK
jgi:hypothetical protein